MSSRFAALSLGLFALLGLSAQEKVVGGPYAVKVTGKTATIGWVVERGEVQLLTEGATTYRPGPVLEARTTSYSSLTPGKQYTYQVAGYPGLTGTFKTATPPGETCEGVVFGDTRTRHELHKKIIAAITPLKPDFVFHTGDLVTDGSDAAQWPVFFDIERPMLKETAFYPSLGNHERNDPLFYEFFRVTTPYYSVDWGDAHFIILNSDVGNAALSDDRKQAFWNEQTRWLEEDLIKSQTAKFRIVVMHHPPITAVKSRAAGNKQAIALIPYFEKYKVQLIFAGHDHNYQHHLQNGIRYVVTGGGGAPLYPVDGAIEGITQKVESTENYVKMRIEPTKITVQAMALDGRTLDSFEVKP